MNDFYSIILASFGAGLIDAMVGGGGLILLPSLFSAYPHITPATLLGTNKATSIWGTSLAAFQYSRKVKIPWGILWPVMLGAVVFGALGAWLATQLDPELMRQLLPFLLLAIFMDTLRQKNLGQSHSPPNRNSKMLWIAVVIGAGIGFYDGFFGPGTGSVLIFLFVRWMSFDFLHASASAKVINIITNGSALITFASRGHVWWQLAAMMACANVMGSFVGTHLAIRYGSRLVRLIFLCVVAALIAKLVYTNLAFKF